MRLMRAGTVEICASANGETDMNLDEIIYVINYLTSKDAVGGMILMILCMLFGRKDR